MTIAIGTAALAALIVPADWDLAVIRMWQALTTPDMGVDRPGIGSFDHAARAALTSAGGTGDDAKFEATQATLTAVSNTDSSRADEWLAAAAAHRLPEFVLVEPPRPDDLTASLPAVPLPHLLAARRGDRPVDAERS